MSGGHHRRQLLFALLTGCLVGACTASAPAAPPTAPAAASPSVSASSGSAASPSPGLLPSPSPSARVSPVVLASGAAPDGSPTPITVFYTQASAGFLSVWVAQDAGLFQQNGLDVSLEQADSASTGLAALLSGQAQVAQIGVTAALDPDVDGADLRIATIVIPVQSFFMEAAPDITSIQDLVGKNVGVGALTGQDGIALSVALQQNGIDPSTVHVLQLNTSGNAGAALINGEVSAMMASPPQSLQLQAQGAHPILDMAAQKLPNAGQGTIISTSYATAHPAVIQAYVDALIQAIARMKADKPFTFTVLQKYLNLTDPQQLEATYDFYVNEVFPALPYPRPELLNAVLPIVEQQDPKLQGLDVNSVVDPTFVQDAAAQGLGQ